MPDILLSGFADEAAPEKTTDQQFSAMAALGLEYLSIRFVDIGKGHGVQNVLEFSPQELQLIRKQLEHYGLKIASIGSPIGKVKIADVDDGTQNRYVPFDQYMAEDVRQAIEVAEVLQTRLIRGFSFYHPRDSNHQDWLNPAIDQLAQIVEACGNHGLTFGLEVEANLIGHHGSVLAEIHRQVNHPALVLIFDGANLVTQGFSEVEIHHQFCEMLPGLGWMHIKDYLSAETSRPQPGEYVDEESLNRFVPCDRGSTGHAGIFQELARHLPTIKQRLAARDIPGFFLDLEPHLRGGGQFGGYSGPDGMGIALRSLCDVLTQCGIGFELKPFEAL
ncbi:MAG: TIM barrel protein [Pirellulaceae bacterium]|nr:TIM barrel protein [Pirellulaceae bacterium]